DLDARLGEKLGRESRYYRLENIPPYGFTRYGKRVEAKGFSEGFPQRSISFSFDGKKARLWYSVPGFNVEIKPMSISERRDRWKKALTELPLRFCYLQADGGPPVCILAHGAGAWKSAEELVGDPDHKEYVATVKKANRAAAGDYRKLAAWR